MIQQPRTYSLALVAVLVLAAALRFTGITRVGLLYDDEGAHATDARLWHRCAVVLTDGEAVSAIFRGDTGVLKQRMETFGVNFGDRYLKPTQGHSFLSALTMFVVGDAPTALLVNNALAGTAAVLLLYALGSILFNRTAALCGALLLAVSPYHLVYCRSALPEPILGCFILIGLFIWVRGLRRECSPRRTYGLAGLALGCAFTCHYRAAYLPLVLVLVDFFAVSHGRNTGIAWWSHCWRAVRRWIWLVAGFAVPILVIEAVFVAAKPAAALMSNEWMPTFLQAHWFWRKLYPPISIGIGGEMIWNVRVPLVYVGYFLHWHGIAAGFLALLGAMILLCRKGVAKALPAVFLITIAFLMFQEYTVARALSVAVPFLCLSMAVGLGWLLAHLRLSSSLKPVMAIVMTVLVAVPAWGHSWKLLDQRSQIADACAFVAERSNGPVAVPFDAHKYRIYLEDAGVEVIVMGKHNRWNCSPEEIPSRLRERGVQWVISDPQFWHHRHPGPEKDHTAFREWQAVNEQLENQAVLVAWFPHISAYLWEFLAEGPGTELISRMAAQGDGPLRVYRLDTLVAGEVRHDGPKFFR